MKNFIVKVCLLTAFVVCCFSTTTITAQNFTGFAADSLEKGADLVILNEKNGSVEFIRYNENTQPEVAQLDEWLNALLQRFTENVTVFLEKTETDNLGHLHHIYVQKHNEINVEYGKIKVHQKEGKVYGISGEYYPIPQGLQSERAFGKEQATEYCKTYFLNQGIDPQATNVDYQGAVFLQRDNQEMTLCHKIDIHGTAPKPKRSYMYLSQKDGSVVFEENRIIHTNVAGTAATKYNGNAATITVDSTSPTNFKLSTLGSRGITTKNLNNGSSYFSATDFVDTDNFWDADSVAHDAHYGAEKTYDYFFNTFGRNSYDNSGARINSYVHYGTNYVNAFWDGTQMTYGDGDGVNYGPLTAIDVVAHEITHALTQNTAGLVYANESGALNESFSDIFAVVIEHYANPSAGNWFMGEQFVLGNNLPFRNFNNPNSLNDPDTYQGTHWDFINQEVHNNGTPHTYWFYLLCNGGTGINDNSQAYNISSIGMTDASAIAYRALTTYLSSNSNYAASRVATIQSAIDLFGTCSSQEIEVTNAWHAVGVGGVYTNSITASFTSNGNSYCSVPASVAFTNTSNNASSYVWDFGDGTTDTTTSPTHVYTTAGTYTVRLIANGASACGGADTITMPNLITVTNGGGPISAACAPTTVSYCCGNGIINFQLNTINATSNNASEGYQDFTCAQSTSVTYGSNYPYSINLGGTISQSYKIYVDLNNNGSFSATELLSSGTGSGGIQTGFISLPSSATLNTPLRMRVISHNTASPLASSCANPVNGQVEDYTITVTAPTSPPMADFTAANFTVTSGVGVPLQDISTNGPTTWTWTIAGGTPTTSTVQNPTITFGSSGSFPVKLVACNSFGCDSITKIFNVVSTFTMCTNDSSTSTAGTLYDSGGPTGVYSNYENCSFLISPGSCTDSIKLHFNAFQLESCCDYFRVYNGPTTSSPLLFTGNGTTIPADITGTAEKMLITFSSDGSVTYAGWDVDWTSFQQVASAPTAGFSFTPTNPAVLDTVFFTDASSANSSAWNWDFGDGGTSSLQNPSHQYSLPGTYTVQLIVESCNAFDTLTQTITTQASPTVSYSPNFFNVSMGCNDTLDLNLLISNTNGGMLNWNITNAQTGNNDLLAWTYGVDSLEEYTNTIAALNQHYTNYNLFTTNTTIPSVMQTLLANKKVLLMPENEVGQLSVIASMASVIQTFVQNGGTLILCGDNRPTAVNLGLFSGTLSTVTSSANLSVVNTNSPLTDSLSGNTISAASATFSYNITNPNKVNVVSLNGNDVVSYLPYGNGNAILLGFDYYAYNSDISQMLGNAVRWGMQGFGNSTNVQATPSSGSLTSGNTDTVTIQVNSTGLSGGLDTAYVIVHTNDTSSLVDTIPVYMTISTMPCVNFGSVVANVCSGTTFFTDSTLNNPTTWAWDFGDGTTSSLQSPTHNYAAAGTYQVKLIATNLTGTDSITKTVVINSIHGPLSTNCVPISNNPNLNYGIQSVILGNINSTTSNATEGYLDLTCTDTTTLSLGSQYQLTINTFNNYDRVFVWLDSNNDGQFSSLEQIANLNAINTTVKQTLLNIPAAGTTLNTPLRMRVMASYYAPNGACYNPYFGQVEDYTVRVDSAIAPPVADFTTSSFTVATGVSVNLLDLSNNGPSSWTWDFPGATPTMSTAQNPSTTFNAVGTYPVKLVACNAFGCDSITKTITVVDPFIICTDDSSTNNAGIIYDSGGPTGNYSANENCTFLITPGTCTDSIKLDFISFFTNSVADALYVYDGPTTSSPLLSSASGTNFPTSVTGTSDKMLLRFTSNSFSTSAGYELLWTAYQQPTPAPTAGFTFAPTTPAVLDTVSFTDASSSSASAWNWNFGDGTFSSLQNPSHQYALPGTYTVTLIAESCNAFDTITQTITTQASPTVSFNPTFFNVSLGCNDTVDVDLMISNTNGGTLNWNIGAAANNNVTGNNLLVWNINNSAYSSTYPNTIAALNQHFTNYTMTTSTTITPSVLQNDLIGKKVMLIPTCSYNNPTVISSCSTVVQNFVQNGGTVITTGDYYNLQNSLGLLTGTYLGFNTAVNTVVNSSTPITDSLPTTFNAVANAYYFNYSNTDKLRLIEFASYDVVAYRPIGQGRTISIGYNFVNFNNQISQVLGNSVRWGMIGSGLSPNVQASPLSGSLTSGNTDTVSIQVNSSGLVGGLDTAYVIVNTNDTSSLTDTVFIYMNISTLPCVNFGSVVASSCSGSVQFTDSTLNSPTTWSWNFGDGNSSSLQNPMHTYTTAGTYQVTLVATNATGTDSITKSVIVNSIHGPVSTACAPVATNPSSAYGIQSVILGNINSTTSNATEGYMDLTCTDTTTLSAGSQYQLTVNTFNNLDRVYVWLDSNNDGQFTANELLANFTTNTTTNHQLVFSLPAIGTTLNTPLRMRVMTSYYSLANACAIPFYGQTEDYTVKVVNALAPPVADFTTANFTVLSGSSVQLQDISSNAPTSWTWTIPGAVPLASTAQNPLVSFATNGSYPIKLVACNSFGCDSVTKIIDVITATTMCVDDSSNSASGIFYDSGGPTGTYQNNQNCTFLISPGSCTDSIKLHFNAFQLEGCCDYFSVYDGPTTSSPLLFSGNGSAIPADITGTANKMLIRFTSDGSVVYAGWDVDWTSYQQVGSAPTAGFTSTPTTPAVLDSVFFTDASSANAAAWDWDFGDGTTSNLQNPFHVYSLPGTYTVRLIVESCNAFDTLTQTITTQASPTVSYNPTSFSVNLDCNDTVDVNLLIANTAGGTLNWNIGGTSATNTAPNNLLVWNLTNATILGNTFTAINQHFPNYTSTTTTTLAPSVMQSLLVNKKVLLIPAFVTNYSIGTMSTVIQNFTQNGGTVIFCGNQYAAFNTLGLMSGSYSSFNTQPNTVVNTSTPLTDSLPTTFNTVTNTLYYNITDPNKLKVIDYSGFDVVTYKPYGQGKVINIGYNYLSLNNQVSQVLGNAVRWGMNGSGLSQNVQVSPTSGSLTSGNTDTVSIQVSSTGLSGGLDTAYVIVNTNDVNSLSDTIPIYMNISTMPCVNFGFDLQNLCSGTVDFTDSTTNNPTSWSWDFGDGNNSTAQNPTHTYAAAGTYQVTLIATNSTGTDSTTRTITINSITSPVASVCNMPTTSSCCGYGLTEFELGNIHSYTGTDVEGYQDLTCQFVDYVTKGASYIYTITTQSTGSQYFSMYLDLNNDGNFTSNEFLFSNTSNFGTLSGTITIPTNSTTGTGLRLRVIASDYTHTACSPISYGQAEDYTLIVLDSIPSADFVAAPTTVYVNQNVQYTDQTTSNPTAWNWNLPGASLSNPVVQNPLVTYNTAGNYDATLIASSSVGSDTMLKVNYITVINLPTISFTYNNTDCEGEVDFLANLPVPYTNVRWYFGDGDSLSSNGNAATHNYASGGTYNVMLVAYSPYGNDTITIPAGVSNWFPTVSHSGSIGVGTTISFSVNSTTPVSSYLWDFGNGSTSSLGSPSTSYNTPGIFYITANVTDANQCTKTIFDTIRIIADGVVDVSANDQIRVYPNPFTDEISLEFSDFGTREDVKIQLLNVTNQVVYAVEKENIDLTKSTMQIPSSAFSPGTYIIKIKINDELYTTKLIKRQ